MTVEDRLRATTEAVSAAMRPLRPLDLHSGADLIEAPAKPRRPRQSRRWSGWLVPLTAAAAVIAVAATLVVVRGSSGAGSASRSTPAAASSSGTGASDSIPPYYVTLNSVKGTATWDAVLGDTATGKALATFKPPSNGNGSWRIANSASDNTFVLYAGPTVTQIGVMSSNKPSSVAFYVLRVSPGAPQRAQPARIPITLANTNIFGAAVSPDGRTLAVLSQPMVKPVPGKTSSKPIPETLRTYSLATGQVLRTWTVTGLVVDEQNGLTWLDDGHTLGFTNLAITGAVTHWDIRTLNTTSPGTNLIADSTVVFHILANTSCGAPIVTLDGKSVICGISTNVPKQCSKGQPALTSYSVATGKLEHVLYRYQATCQFGSAVPLWAPSGSFVIGVVQGVVTHVVNHYSHSSITTDLGIMTPAKFTPLPIAQTDAINGSVAFAAF